MSTVTAFFQDRRIARGERETVVREIERGYASSDFAQIRTFSDEDGRVVDLDYFDAGKTADPPRDGEGDRPKGGGGDPASAPRTRGRPKLGVSPREVTLLPRHWDWLARQPGGASAALRRLVEQASRAGPGPAERRDSAYRFMQQMCGDRPGYEEALRALYRGDSEGFEAQIAEWPEDVRAYIAHLLGGSGPA
jgi:hypothetical protein